MASSLFLNGKIKTTEAKAKEVRSFAEKLITRAKEEKISNQRLVSGLLAPQITKKLFNEIALNYANRQGGCVRIVKLGPRKSDGAKMAIIELVK